MTDEEPRCTVPYFMCRLSSDDLHRLDEIVANRRDKAPRFYDWLGRLLYSELARRMSFHDGGTFTEAGPIDLTDLHRWCGFDLAGALKQVVCLEDGMSRREPANFLQQLRRGVVAIVCYRLKSDTEEDPYESDSESWGSQRDLSDQQEDHSSHDL